MESKALDILFTNYPQLESCREDITAAYNLLAECYDGGGMVFTCGNGGSCADADHITGELLKGFCKKRPLPAESKEAFADADKECGAFIAERLQVGLPAISLMNFPGAGSAVANDLDGLLGPAQLLYALGRKGRPDVLLALSTSGNARNVRYAVAAARVLGMKVIGFTGEGGGFLGANADVTIKVPARDTYRIQEYHLPVYHALCLMIEERYFSE